MLNKTTFSKGIEKLLHVYPNWKIKFEDSEVMRTWYSFFQQMDDDRFMHMVHSFIKNEDRLPTVSGLNKNDTMPRKSKEQLKHEQMLRDIGYHD